MKILKVKHTNLYDVFLGDGWEHHVRVYFKKGKKMSFVGHNTVRLSQPQRVTLQLKLHLMQEE